MSGARRLLPFLALLSMLFVTESARAHWLSGGTPVTQAEGEQLRPHISSDDANGLYAVWWPSLFAQRLTRDGDAAPGWGSNGVWVDPGPIDGIRSWGPWITSDGGGGVYVTFFWIPSRGNPGYPYSPQEGCWLCVQHLDGRGQRFRGWPSEGVFVTDRIFNGAWYWDNADHLALAPDGEGGVLIAWKSWGNQNDITMQRIAADTTKTFGASGLLVCGAPGHQRFPALVPDGHGGTFVFWSDWRDAPRVRVFGQHVLRDGRTQWAADGVAISKQSYVDVSAPVAIDDHGGGSLLVWSGTRGTDYDILATRVTPGGGVPWKDDAIVCAATGDQYDPHAVLTRSGETIIAWFDRRRAGSIDVFAQRIDRGGRANWSRDGVPLTATPAQRIRLQIADDAGEGAYAAWANTGSNARIQAIRIGPNGTIASPWASDGVAVSAQLSPGYGGTDYDFLGMVGETSGEPIVAWAAGVHGSDGYSPERLWAMKLTADGPAAPPPAGNTVAQGGIARSMSSTGGAPHSLELSLRAVRPNPVVSGAMVDFALPEAGPAMLELYDVTGRRLWHQELTVGEGAHAIRLPPSVASKAGVYVLRLSQGIQAVQSRIAVTP